jgi:sister chromatid cohesion protein DCC1
MRSVVLSNSVLVVTSPPNASSAEFSNDDVVIRDQVNEIMELTPSVPKLHKLAALLRGREYDEGEDDVVPNNLRVRSTIYIVIKCVGKTVMQQENLSYEDALAEIQASDSELDRALKDRHILNINGDQHNPALLVLILTTICRRTAADRPFIPQFAPRTDFESSGFALAPS